MTPSQRSTVRAYAVAFAAVTAAAVVRFALDDILGSIGSNLPFLLAVIGAAWYGGLRPGMAATVLSVAVVIFLFIPPSPGWKVVDPSDALRLLLFIVSSVAISGVCESLHRARRRLEREQHVRETSEAFHRAISDLSSDFAYRAHVSRDGRIVADATTDGFTRITGYAESDLSGHEWMSLIHPDDYLDAVDAARKLLNGEPTEGDIRIRAKDGRLIWLRYRNRPVRDNAGRVIQIYGAARDVTEERAAQIARRASEERERAHAEELEKILAAVPAVIFIATDPQCRWIVGSRFSHELLGVPLGRNLSLSATQMERPPYRVLVGGVEVSPDELPMQQAVKGIERTGAELEIRLPDGARRHLYGNTIALRDSKGQIRGAVGAFVNVTALKEADRRKEEFLATLAHELRNPLAPIRNAVEILGARGILPHELQSAHDVILRQVGQMVHLVNDLLDISRISRNELQIRRERINIGDVLKNAVETSRPIIDGANHRLTVRLPARAIVVEGDPTRLAQVVSNLLNNAAKYTPAHGDITLSAEQQGEDVVVSVRDSGIGISREHLTGIFEMFSQVQPALERPEGGLGIGLSLVKRVVELHGGSVEARSEGLGLGSEFVVRLRVVAGEPVPAATPAEPPIQGAKAIAGSRVLVVDDNRDAADSLAELLRMGGVDVTTVYDGPSALEMCTVSMPEVVLLDIGLPGLNGYEVARRIRALPNGSETVLVAVTGWGKDEDRRRSQDAGFDHHLVKPVEPSVIEGLLARSTAVSSRS